VSQIITIILLEITNKKNIILRHIRKWDNNIKVDFKGTGVRVWTEFNWLRMGFGGGLF
jgi:hypothetical protein